MVVATLPGAVVSLDVPAWGLGVDATGVDATGMDAIGVDVTGMAETGAVAIGTAATGTVIGIITVTITLFSSATSVFPAGGAGAGADILTEVTRITDTDMATRTVTTAMDMDILATDTAIMGTETVMATATGTIASTALLPDRE
jgi:hypothetical protein